MKQYYRARYYDTAIGRFISEDPLQWFGSENFYEYAESDPINLVDPSGLTSKNCCKFQDFTFSQGHGRYTATELQAVAATAFGEAGIHYNAGEAEAIIATMINRQTIDLMYAQAPTQSMRPHGYKLPFHGTAITDILSQYDAYKQDQGDRKLGQAKALHNGVIPADSEACKQLIDVMNFTLQVSTMDPQQVGAEYPYTWNYGGPRHRKKGEFNWTAFGHTHVWMTTPKY